MDEYKICPFRSAVGCKCAEERCALWFQIRRDDGTVKYEGCSFAAMSRAMTEIATTGIEVYPQ